MRNANVRNHLKRPAVSARPREWSLKRGSPVLYNVQILPACNNNNHRTLNTDGAVVKTLASHRWQWPGQFRPNTICGLSLLLILALHWGIFSRFSGFPLSTKTSSRWCGFFNKYCNLNTYILDTRLNLQCERYITLFLETQSYRFISHHFRPCAMRYTHVL